MQFCRIPIRNEWAGYPYSDIAPALTINTLSTVMAGWHPN